MSLIIVWRFCSCKWLSTFSIEIGGTLREKNGCFKKFCDTLVNIDSTSCYFLECHSHVKHTPFDNTKYQTTIKQTCIASDTLSITWAHLYEQVHCFTTKTGWISKMLLIIWPDIQKSAPHLWPEHVRHNVGTYRPTAVHRQGVMYQKAPFGYKFEKLKSL